MWYIWKNNNDKIYKNDNSHEILRMEKIKEVYGLKYNLQSKKKKRDLIVMWDMF